MKLIGCLQKQFLNTQCSCQHIKRAIALVRFRKLQQFSFDLHRRLEFQARRPSVRSCACNGERHVSSLCSRNPLEDGIRFTLASVVCLTLVCIGGSADANNVVGRQQAQQAFTRSLGGSSTSEGRPSVSIADQVTAINKLTLQAQASADAGAYQDAVDSYSKIVKQFPGLALAERARIRRAVLLYETGQVQQAIVELDDEEVALRGNAEVHAALAALLYAERPLERQRAELQWELASEFDTRYSDVKWVAAEKKWGPRLLSALQHFLALE